MKTNYQTQDQRGNIYQQIYELIEKQPGTWQSVGALTGLFGAVLCPLLGVLLGTVTWFVVSPRAISVLHVVSVAAFALTVPLLASGAHCLDLIEKKIRHRSSSNQRASHKSVHLNASAQRGG